MKSKESFMSKCTTFLIFAGPAVISFILVVIIPMIYGVYLTFTSWDGFSNAKPFVGLANYGAVFQDKAFWTALWITVKYVFLSVIFINAIAFILAYLLTSGIKGQNFLRAGFFTPNLIGGIVLGYIWQFIFSRVIVNLNDFMNLPIFAKSWLSSPGGAFAAMVIVTTWQYSGYMLLIYISGFVSVSQDLLEAARIDGGSSGQVTRYITIPMMMPSFVTCLFLSLTRCFKVYDLNLALTGGGPYDSTKMAAMHIYTQAFENHKYGVGQAEALVLFLVMGIIAFIQIKTGKAKEVEA
ncbi:MAG: sugar ABC transporter permease [Hungatella sp.]|nr:sugar ABC transporter permease [Hungatella sp.]